MQFAGAGEFTGAASVLAATSLAIWKDALCGLFLSHVALSARTVGFQMLGTNPAYA
jgi:hypothetical protein